MRRAIIHKIFRRKKMLDIKRIRENLDDIKKAMDRRGEKEFDLDAVVALDDERRELLKEVEVMKNEMNIESKKIPQLIKAGKDVTLIARNAHLEAMKKQGLSVEKMWINETETIPVGAESMESYEAKGEKADVILVCVKKYSLDSCIPFIQNISHENTIVLPVLNVYGTGASKGSCDGWMYLRFC